MSFWLYQFPDSVIVLASVMACVALMSFVHAACHRVFRSVVPVEGIKFAESIHNSLIALATLVLAFSLIQAIGNFRQANSLVATEAAQLSNLDRLLVRVNEMTTNQIAVLGALLGLVFVFDEPFLGQTSVQPDHFVDVIRTIENRID